MIKARVLPVSVDEAEAIARIVRDADRDEICQGLNLDMAYALRMCFGGSRKASKIVVEGKIVAVFGDADHDAEVGVPWLISTKYVDRHPRAFLAVCKAEVREMMTRHQMLVNYVDARNTQAIRWLKWLGFKFGPAAPYGPNDLPFFYFEMN